ncbi:leucoanthocyanidin reductase-like [Melia azedarach]|uniref:Leucoanthocyanidin reductase-like n=1 Tax=Melia azedarach TaxID=155640 RepID=A0ACC1XHY4_MELAZ|nr:leucoanthocyanidin reductase-like [Melia azedarach]
MTVSGVCVSPAAKSRVLVVGATGFIGRFVVEASLASGRPTYILVRLSSNPGSPCKTAKIAEALRDKGAIILYGSINDRELMEKILKEHEIDIVISAVGGEKVLDQLTLVEAIKAVGTVKRFLPSEFGHDIDRAEPVEPGIFMYKEKRKVIPPLDQFQIYGDGSVKAYFVAGTDIGKFTMRTVDDIRTLNKSVHFRPPCNFYNMNELASLWEKKIGRTLPRVVVTENDLLTAAAENRIPQSVVASFTHDIFIKGCQVNFSIDGPDDIEVTDLYPDEQFRTLDDCFNDFVIKMKAKSMDIAD